MLVHLTMCSSNQKTGPIPVSTTSKESCPASCPLKGAGCYAESGPLGLHWKAVTNADRGTDYPTFLKKIEALPRGQLWRHNQAGDLIGDGVKVDGLALSELAEANYRKRGFTYTHYDASIPANADAIAQANDCGFIINLSANSLPHADQLCDLNVGPVVVIQEIDAPRKEYTPAGRLVASCPATYREDISCATCQLCQRMERDVIVGFPAHGARKKRVIEITRAA